MKVRRSGGGGYYQQGFKGPKKICDVCGLWFYRESEMVRQDGYWKCTIGPRCVDKKYDRED